MKRECTTFRIQFYLFIYDFFLAATKYFVPLTLTRCFVYEFIHSKEFTETMATLSYLWLWISTRSGASLEYVCVCVSSFFSTIFCCCVESAHRLQTNWLKEVSVIASVYAQVNESRGRREHCGNKETYRFDAVWKCNVPHPLFNFHEFQFKTMSFVFHSLSNKLIRSSFFCHSSVPTCDCAVADVDGRTELNGKCLQSVKVFVDVTTHPHIRHSSCNSIPIYCFCYLMLMRC